MNWFADCRTLDEIKKRYQELSQENHPDHGGDEETMKAINAAYESKIRHRVDRNFADFENDRGWRPQSQGWFEDVILAAMELDITIEMIGTWVYAFDAFEVKDELKGLGFWWSIKHKAWVFNGRKKARRATMLNTEEVRWLHGSRVLKVKEGSEERIALPA